MKKLFLLLFFIFSLSVVAQNTQRSITVTGTAVSFIQVEKIVFTISIETISQSMEQSRIAAEKAAEEVKEILSASQISEFDIQIAPITLNKKYDYVRDAGQVFKGYAASIDILFDLKDFTYYAELCEKLSKVKNLEIKNAQFDLENETKVNYNLTVLKNALEAAENKAKEMAATLHLRLGNAITIEEIPEQRLDASGYSNTLRDVRSEEAENIGGSAPVGKVSIKKRVRVVFELIIPESTKN